MKITKVSLSFLKYKPTFFFMQADLTPAKKKEFLVE